VKTYYIRLPGGTAAVQAAGAVREVTVDDTGAAVRVAVQGGPPRRVDLAEIVPGSYSLLIDGRSHTLVVASWHGGGPGAPAYAGQGGVRVLHLLLDGISVAAESGRSPRLRDRAPAAAGAAGQVRAPMPGLIVSIQAGPGSAVAAGQPLLIMEAMKMQMEIRAPHAGTVRTVHVTPGQDVGGGDLLVTVE
jgi:hypothetical protein